MNEDKAARYHRLQRRSAFVSTLLTAALLVWLHVSGASGFLRDAAATIPGGSVPVFVLLLGLALEAVSLPLSFHRHFILERRFGLSTASLRFWAGDHVKAILLGLGLGLVGAEAVYFTLRHWPAVWWLVSAGLFMAGLFVLSMAGPVFVLPLFYALTPLDREALRSRLVALSARAGVPVLDIYRWGLGDKTRRANAALVGTGSTRRILLSDTLVDEYSDDEIAVIIAHELAHHVRHDIPKALLVECGWLVAVFYACAVALETPWLTSGLHSRADIAGLPLLLIVAGAMTLVGTPVMNAVSRSNERRADRYALALTGHPAAFISAMRRLSVQNLAEPSPSRLVRWLFYTHPPVRERIDAARSFSNGDRSAASDERTVTAAADPTAAPAADAARESTPA